MLVETECGHCQRPMRIEIDSELQYRVLEGGEEPMVYAPLVDLHNLAAPSIIDDF